MRAHTHSQRSYTAPTRLLATRLCYYCWFAMVVSAFRFALGIVAAFSLFVFVADSQGVFPCHSGREQLGAPGCTDITLPYDLCKNCPIKDVAPNGDFKNCRSIYDIDAPKCMGQLIQYVQMNTCDWRRAEQMDQWLNSGDNWVKAQAKEKLDYFVYAVCEECCDCIPISSSYKDYSVAAQNEDDLFTHTRGNCAAHAYYDVSSII